METYCKRCLAGSELEGLNCLPNYGLIFATSLCEICMEELNELLEKFFKEVQIVRTK